ncbi:actin, cytoplasmic type 5-like isoform X3 [Pituophis catenifer annectens]|uniref:actin, cytoplasmic type 5-like isoform X3 n=1 Tax=Pituophis catenifer annectens TaxID=94852 RepID=UPI00399356AE
MADQETTALVVDNSSRNCRAGIAGEDLPRIVLPPIIGRPKQQSAVEDRKAFYVGSDAQSRRDVLTLRYPIQSGLVFKSEAEKITQIMFESFNASAFYLAFHAVLSLYASGRTSGVVLDTKNDRIDPLPVYEGHALRHAFFRVDLSGEDLTDFLLQMLNKRGYHIKREEREMVEDIKEKFCYVAPDFVKEMATATPSSLEKQYELPDGQVITIDTERYRCPEGLFEPGYLNKECCGIHETVFNAVMKCDRDLCRTMFKNVVLAGGTSMLPGFAERLQMEMAPLAPLNAEVNIVAPPNRTCSSWVGGSLLASLPHFQQMCISKKEYEEFGPALVHRKCF